MESIGGKHRASLNRTPAQPRVVYSPPGKGGQYRILRKFCLENTDIKSKNYAEGEADVETETGSDVKKTAPSLEMVAMDGAWDLEDLPKSALGGNG